MNNNRSMLTDLYQLTMMAAYHDSGKKDDTATFDLFIRKLPDDWGYFIANGIEDAIDYATSISFTDDDVSYLRDQGIFKEEFLESLSGFRFGGEIAAVPEGTAVAPNTPLIRVTANRSEAQILETLLLTPINFQTMIASKASRIVRAAGEAGVVDYGLRRAQEKDAAMTGARATYIAGGTGTSNVLAGKEYGIPIKGTMAHSFVMGHDSELEAFRAYVRTYPKNGILLVDTYDTIQGVKNAAIVANELKESGGNVFAVRLDSGDLAELSKNARKILDDAGLPEVKVTASNDLNEYKIDHLNKNGACIDGFGVGTEQITAKPVAAIPGVYKLVEDENGPKIKLAPGKVTYPGRKQVYRVSDEDGNSLYDVLALEGEDVPFGTPLLETVVRDGRRIVPRRSLDEIRSHAQESVNSLPEEALRLQATPYEMRPSSGLQSLVEELRETYGGAK